MTPRSVLTRSVLNWMALGLVGLVGCQQAPAYAEPTGAAAGAIEFCGQSLDLKTTEVKCLYENDVTDLSPLSGLTGLTTLLLSRTRVRDLSPLAGLTGLARLELNGNPVTDLSPLSGLTGLTSLSLQNIPVYDLSPLSGLPGLTRLEVNGIPFRDLSPLAGLTGLTELTITITAVSELSPLAGLTGLTKLELNGNPVTDLSPLAGLTGLTELDLRGTKAAPEDVDALRKVLPRCNVAFGSGGSEGGMSGAEIQALFQAEAREAELRAKQRNAELDRRAAATVNEAAAVWSQLQPLLAAPDPEAVLAAERFVAAYSKTTVWIEDLDGRHDRAVVIAEVAKAEQWLKLHTERPDAGTTGKLGYEMVRIPAGGFTMGSPSSEEFRYIDEGQHRVRITKPYLLGKTEVTQGLWESVMGSNPSHFSSCGSDCPVENVSWVDAAKFANALSRDEGLQECYRVSGDDVSWSSGLSCTGYRLPTEAEWEYAARAGEDTLYAGGNSIDSVAWTSSNSGKKTRAVGGKQANAWGLHDMSGNVWEWTWDVYGTYPSGSATDPTGASTGAVRVLRGGGWYFIPRYARLSIRVSDSPGLRINFLGLRLARSIP